MSEQYDKANHAKIGNGIMAAAAFSYRAWWMLFTIPGTMGKRVVDDAKESLYCLGVMTVWLAFGKSPNLLLAVGLAVAMQLVHRARPAGKGVHSKSVGRSWLAWLLRCRQALGRGLEALLAIVLGLLVLDAGDPALGSLLCVMGVSCMVVYSMVLKREAAMDADLMDAVIQQRAQQERLRDLLNNR